MKPYWIFAFVALTACSGAAEIPDTPDLTALQVEYDNPSATLDATTVQETLEEIPPLDALAAGFRASGLRDDRRQRRERLGEQEVGRRHQYSRLAAREPTLPR